MKSYINYIISYKLLDSKSTIYGMNNTNTNNDINQITLWRKINERYFFNKNVDIVLTNPHLSVRNVYHKVLPYFNTEIMRALMAKTITLTEDDLAKERNKLQNILRNIERLEQAKSESQETIRVLERLLNGTRKNLDSNAKEEISTESRLFSLTGIEAYRKLFCTDLKGKDVTENEIRKLANAQGLKVRGKEISPATSRGIINDLYKKKFIVRSSYGRYCYNEEQEKT